MTDLTFVPIGRSTADLTVAECSDLIECLYERGAAWGIVWSEPELWHKNSPSERPPPEPQVSSSPAEAASVPLQADAASHSASEPRSPAPEAQPGLAASTAGPGQRRRLSSEEAIALLPVSRVIRSAILKDGVPLTSEWTLDEVTHDLRHAKVIALSDKCRGFPIGMQDNHGRVVFFERKVT